MPRYRLQVDYSQYSAAPWVLPMGGLLSLHSGCADLTRDTVQVMRISALKVGAVGRHAHMHSAGRQADRKIDRRNRRQIIYTDR